MKQGKLTNAKLQELVINKITPKNSETVVGAGVGEDCCAVRVGSDLCVVSTDPITAGGEQTGTLAIHILSLIHIWAKVFIRRSNDVIPEILGATPVQDGGLVPIEKPEFCPACGTKLEEIGPNLYCPNSLNCKPQLTSRMVHFVSRDAMDIENLSEKTIGLLFEKMDVKDIAAIYSVTREQLLEQEGFKAVSYTHLRTGLYGAAI